MGTTKIEWADRVWNPVTGCTKVSEGCRNCYAERIAGRFWGERKFSDVQCHEDRLNDPLHWKKPSRVFVNSMSDLFHPDVPTEFIKKVFTAMAACQSQTFLILTKRPIRMLEYLSVNPILMINQIVTTSALYFPLGTEAKLGVVHWPLPNVWLGVSVENQMTTDERIPLLIKTPAAVRFVSIEPMLGPVDLKKIKWAKIPINKADYRFGAPAPNEMWSMRDALYLHSGNEFTKPLPGLDWVICGGESGPNARPMHPDWARSVRDQCQGANVPFFFKSWGGNKRAGRLLDGQEWNEFPEVK